MFLLPMVLVRAIGEAVLRVARNAVARPLIPPKLGSARSYSVQAKDEEVFPSHAGVFFLSS